MQSEEATRRIKLPKLGAAVSGHYSAASHPHPYGVYGNRPDTYLKRSTTPKQAKLSRRYR